MQPDTPKKATGFPARLHVLIARNAPVGLVIRRGPAERVATFSWNRRTDTIVLGQWMKGYIHERRADLSPDGKHWIYFAVNGRWSDEAQGAWTAVARAPWLKAETLLAKGDCWQGGGLFLDNRSFWVDGGDCHEPLQLSRDVKRKPYYEPSARYGWEGLTVYYNRLQRDGWTLVSLDSERGSDRITLFERRLPHGWTLQKLCHANAKNKRPQGTGVYWDEHVLINETGDTLTFPKWRWADWIDDRLVYAEAGALYRRDIRNAKELGPPRLIHDFNAYTFEERRAAY